MQIIINEGFAELEIVINCPAKYEGIENLIVLLHSLDKKLTGSLGGKTHIIDISDVLYFETVDKRNFIYTELDVFETPLMLYEIETQLSSAGFFRSGKSQIVSIAKISALCPEFGGRLELTMQGGEKIIVSRQYAKELKERLGL